VYFGDYHVIESYVDAAYLITIYNMTAKHFGFTPIHFIKSVMQVLMLCADMDVANQIYRGILRKMAAVPDRA
jgi:hypothetical protein